LDVKKKILKKNRKNVIKWLSENSITPASVVDALVGRQRPHNINHNILGAISISNSIPLFFPCFAFSSFPRLPAHPLRILGLGCVPALKFGGCLFVSLDQSHSYLSALLAVLSLSLSTEGHK
jgi:hypothetical protein